MKKALLTWVYGIPILKQQYLAIVRPLYINIYKSYKKGEVRQWWHWLKAGHMVRDFKIRRLLQSGSPINLQVGGGYHTISGWLNGDIIAGDIYLDASSPIPLPDATVDYIFTEQFFEHIPYEDGTCFLREAYRVLKPGGVIRQATPSLRGLVEVYFDKNERVSQQQVLRRHNKNHNRNCLTGAQFLNEFFRLWGHQFIYDQETLTQIHQQAGFIDVRWQAFGESEHEILQNRERHADTPWLKSAIVIFCEATKPLT